jgi:distribution and morphology protein 31
LPIHNLDNYSDFFRRLALSLPHLHRPTKDDFLNVANGFWQRTRIRFKWFTIKSFRKFNADDISAFITWFVMSQTLWILVGTTTFFSVVFATINSLRLQEYVARGISDYLTSETGVTIIFESAIVPKWKDSRISFKNVYVSCRPRTQSRPQTKVDIGHRAAAGYDVANHPSFFHHDDENDGTDALGEVEEEWNYSMFDLTIDSVDVTLSLWRWLDGRGLVEDAVVKGVRGVLDRRSVIWNPDLEPALFRHPSRPGDFELDSLQLEDVLITVYQPNGFRPYTASIFHADIQAFRKRWLFYDLLNAESMVGQFDGCLFSLHRPQRIGRTNESDAKEGDQSRMTRIRMDGINVDHLQGATSGSGGPVSWITSGKVDVVLDITFPRDTSSLDLNELLGEIADSITNSLALDRIPGQRELAKPPLSAPDTTNAASEKTLLASGEGDEDKDPIIVEEQPKVMFDIDLRFRDLKAAVPMFPGELSYVNSALIRPIVAFINANRVLVPIHCRVVKNLSDFDGSWTMWEAGLTDEISLKMYEALAYHVTQINMNRRIKTVSIWSLHITVNALLSALRSAMDPVTTHLKEVYAREHESGLGYGMSFAT